MSGCGDPPVIHIEVILLATEPIDMRTGADTALARVVKVCGAAQAHHAYLFTNRRANRMKVLVHDGFGLWLCARRLHQGYFVWPHSTSTSAPGAHDTPPALTLSRAQLDALVLGLPWPRLADGGAGVGAIHVVCACITAACCAARSLHRPAIGACPNRQDDACAASTRPR